MSPQYGELRPTNGWDPSGSLRHPCKFQRVSRLGSVTARHLDSGRQPNVAALNRGRHLCSAGRPSRWALAHILVIIRSHRSTTYKWCCLYCYTPSSVVCRLTHTLQKRLNWSSCFFGLRTRVGPRNHILDGSLYPHGKSKGLVDQSAVARLDYILTGCYSSNQKFYDVKLS